MNQTSEEPRETPGPQYREQLRDFDRLRRSSTDRYVAGVCGGLGRHFGIDPTIIRILLAVMCLFGGAGLLIYAAVWIFVPEDDRQDAPVNVDPESRRVLVLVAAAIAVLCLIGSSWGGFGWGGGWGAGWTIGIIAVILAVVLGSRRRTGIPGPDHYYGPAGRSAHEARQGDWNAGTASSFATQAPAAATPTAAQAPPAGSSDAAAEHAPQGPASADTARFEPGGAAPRPPAAPPSAGAPYAPPPPMRPRKPRRTGLLLFWPTLALILVGWGVLGLYDIDHHVSAAAWPALALAITGVMLLIGAFVGRPGGLILIGCLLVGSLSVAAVADSVTWEKHRVFTPATAGGVADSYAITNGRMVVDLSEVRNPARLDGRTIEAHLDAGEIEVILPPGVAADVDADITVAGSIDLGSRREDGFGPSSDGRVGPANARAEIDLRTWVQVGHIEVRTAAEGLNR